MNIAESISQRIFRALLQAMSHPGKAYRLASTVLAGDEECLIPIVCCLLDPEVRYSVIGTIPFGSACSGGFDFTGSQLSSVSEADFLFIFGPDSGGAIQSARRGSPERPDLGATLIYYEHTLSTCNTDRFRILLKGPGIAEPQGRTPDRWSIGLDETRRLMAVNADYPLGIDSFFVWPDGALIGLPRSTDIQIR
jgi:alpha-D-ribose 1-methylphosphonate 5-triphosphate synthase subunit PhnH